MVKNKCLNGFTLLELLVVLAIIGTLLALAAPHYFGNIEKAKEAVLRENLNILRSTMDKYYSDTGRYPQSLSELVGKKIPKKDTRGSRHWKLCNMGVSSCTRKI